MAEHLGRTPDMEGTDAFSMMGKPLSATVRQKGFEHCKDMGLDSTKSWLCVNAVSMQLERDEPYKAMADGTLYLDLTGVYRLFAVLLTAAAEEYK